MADSKTICASPIFGVFDREVAPMNANSPDSVLRRSLHKCPFSGFEVNLFQNVVRFGARNGTCHYHRNGCSILNRWIKVPAFSA